MIEVQAIDTPQAATIALDPVRSRILAELAEPASAASLALRLGITRQKANYHLRSLESHGLAEIAGEHRWGGLTERLLVATASSYVISPNALGPAAADPHRSADRLSASYLLALAARVIREISTLMRRSRETNKGLATLSIDSEVRFRSASDRAAFCHQLTKAITSLISCYHDATAPGGRAHRLVLVAHPVPNEDTTKEKP